MYSSTNVAPTNSPLANNLISCHQQVKKTKRAIMEAKKISTQDKQAEFLRETALHELKSSNVCQQVRDCLHGKLTFNRKELQDLVNVLNRETNLGNWQLKELSDRQQPIWIVSANHLGVQPGLVLNQLQDCLKVRCFNYDVSQRG